MDGLLRKHPSGLTDITIIPRIRQYIILFDVHNESLQHKFDRYFLNNNCEEHIYIYNIYCGAICTIKIMLNYSLSRRPPCVAFLIGRWFAEFAAVKLLLNRMDTAEAAHR